MAGKSRGRAESGGQGMTTNEQSPDNADVVRRVFDAVGQRDLDGLLGLYHRDVVVREPRCLPHGGNHRGLDQVRAAAIRWAQTWGPYQRDPRLEPELFASTGDHVVARWRLRAHDQAGEGVDVEAIDIYRLRDGKVLELETYYRDTAELVSFLERASRAG
jgi:ketosteroid isomerase-like protein